MKSMLVPVWRKHNQLTHFVQVRLLYFSHYLLSLPICITVTFWTVYELSIKIVSICWRTVTSGDSEEVSLSS